VVLGVNLVAVVVAVIAVELPLLRAGPLPEDCLSGSAEYSRLRVWATAAAVGAGWTAALLGLFRPLGGRAGFYGQTAACLLAALALTAMPEPLRRPGEPLGWPGWMAVGLAAGLLCPALRERGMLSLMVPPLFLGLLFVHGRRENQAQGLRAMPLAAVQEAVDVAGREPFLSVVAHMPTDQRRALVLGLRQPFFDRDVNVLMVDWDSPEELWLQNLAQTRLRLDGVHVVVSPGAPEPPAVRLLQVEAIPGPDGSLAVGVSPTGTQYLVRIVTPTGVFRYQMGGNSVFSGLDEVRRRSLQQLLGPPLPSGLPVLIVAEAVGMMDAFGWVWVRSP
jgi:hypothetical protein